MTKQFQKLTPKKKAIQITKYKSQHPTKTLEQIAEHFRINVSLFYYYKCMGYLK